MNHIPTREKIRERAHKSVSQGETTVGRFCPLRVARALLFGCFTGLSGAAAAFVTNTWTGAANDWNWALGENYSLGLPAAGDLVEIPDNVTAHLLATDSASASVVNGLRQIRPTGAGSRLIVETDATHDLTLSCPITSGCDDKTTRYGELVKRGAGTLTLGEGTRLDAYYTTLTAEEGVLRLPTSTRPGYQHSFSRLSVSNGATLFTVGNRGYTVVFELLGTGTVANDSKDECYLQIRGGTRETPTPVAAYLRGNVRLYTLGCVDILCPSNAMSSATTVRRSNSAADSVLGLLKIGNSGAVGSPGTYQFLRWSEYGGVLRYLGSGESTTKGLDVYTRSPYLGLCAFDGGPFGGLTFSSSQIRATYSTYNLVLTGTNAAPCVVACPVTVSQFGGTNTYVTLTKRGSGAWRFSHNLSRAGIANVSVEEGSLQYDSLYEKGEMCALGSGLTNYPSGYCGLSFPERTVSTSIVLGDPAGESLPTFEYTGSANGAWNTTRTLALRGDVRLLNSSKAVDGKPLPLRLSNFSNTVSRTATLFLAGDDAAAENQIANVKDGAEGAVALVKTGSGIWNLTGTNNTFTGGLAVSNGTLRVLASDGKFTWFRWNMMQTRDSSCECKTYLFGLYGADWKRIHGALTLNSDYTAIRSGEVAHQRRMYNYYGRGVRDLDKLSSATTTDSTCMDFMEYVNVGGNDKARGAISKDDETTWIRCLMRLAPDCEEACSYDLATYYNNGQTPGVWSLEGSVNGMDWNVLHRQESCPFSDSLQWAYGRKVKAWVTNAACHTNGQAIVGHGTVVTRTIPSGCPVSVAAGATLESVGTTTIDVLKLAADGNGTFKGITLATTGEILTDVPANVTVTFPCTFLNADGSDLRPDFSRWTLRTRGHVRKGRLEAVDGGIRYTPAGMMLIVR